MLTDQFTRDVNDFLQQQGDLMLRKQAAINRAVYNERTGSLSRALSGSPAVGTDGGVSADVSYPKHIRFLDMKRGSGGRRKTRYAPIYNRYVYGYLKSALWKRMARVIPTHMIHLIDATITSVR